MVGEGGFLTLRGERVKFQNVFSFAPEPCWGLYPQMPYYRLSLMHGALIVPNAGYAYL